MRSYLVCGTNRSGSTLLCELLRSTRVAGRPSEYFWRGNEPAWTARWGASEPDEYVRAAIEEGTTANRVFGAHVMWAHMPDLTAKLVAAHGNPELGERELLERAFPNLRFVWIWREDLVAQAVSFSRATQTGEWRAGAPGRSEHPPRFSFKEIKQLLGEVTRQNEAAERWFAANGIEPHRVRYEDLVEDTEGVTRGVLAFLGVELPSGAMVEAQVVKQADGLNDEWAARYREAAAPSS
jgi:LPS sulfotransferase NodH